MTAILLMTGGCLYPDRIDPLDDPAVQELRERVADNENMPLPYTVAVAVPELVPEVTYRPQSLSEGEEGAETLSDVGDTAQGGGGREGGEKTPAADASDVADADTDAAESGTVATLPLDAIGLQREVVEQLEAMGMFHKVVALKPIADTGGEPSLRHDLVLSAAADLKADFVLIPRVTRHESAYSGISIWWVPSVVSAVAAWFPTFFFPDENWTATAEVQWELVNLRQATSLWNGTSAPARAEGQLNDFERSWDLWGPFGIPLLTDWEYVGADEGNFQAAGSKLLPVSLALAEADLLLQLGDYLTTVPIRLDGTKPETHALVIGVDSPGSGVARLKAASNDAVAMAAHLTEPTGGGVDPENVVVLLNENATLDAISEYIDVEIRRRARLDHVIFYFAGYGTTDNGGNGFLLVHGSDPDDLSGTALPLTRLLRHRGRAARKAAADPAGTAAGTKTTTRSDESAYGILDHRARATVILDTSFGGEGGRTLAREGAAPLARADLVGAFELEPKGILLAASDTVAAALEYEPEGHGLFTLVLLGGLVDGDLDGDGQVSAAEASAWVTQRVPMASAVLGQLQEPLFATHSAAEAEGRQLSRPGFVGDSPRAEPSPEAGPR